MNEFPVQAVRWFKHLAVKGVEELLLINRPWPLEALMRRMPDSILSMTSLTRLYLGFLRFPDTPDLQRSVAFPCLRELGLCSVIIEPRDIEFVLATSPMLDVLSIQGHMFPLLHLRLVSQSLRCVQIYASQVETVDVVAAPRLERLIMSRSSELSCNIKIGCAPALHLFGFFDMGKDQLQIGDKIIKAGTRASLSTMVTTIKILALPVRFGVRGNAMMLPGFLRFFPNLKTLHIHSEISTESHDDLNIKFWQEFGAIECVHSQITTLSFRIPRGKE